MRNAGMSIESLIEYVALFKKGNETLEARKNLLLEQKLNLLKKQEEINNTIKRLDYKIKIYDEIMQGKRKNFFEEP